MMRHIKFGFDWPSGFREDVMVIYMYIAPGQGQTAAPNLGHFIQKHKSSVHLHTPCKSPPPTPYNYFYLFYPIKRMDNLCWPSHKIGQGHPKVMFYINFVELLSVMFHAKFQNHRPSGSGEEDF